MVLSRCQTPLAKRSSRLLDLGEPAVRRIDEMHTRRLSLCAGEMVDPSVCASQRVFVVVSGWLSQSRRLVDGRRQILNLLLPGDRIAGLQSAAAMSSVELECLSGVQLAEFVDNGRGATFDDEVARALRANDALDAAIVWNCIDRLSRQSGYERLAHLFLDLEYRLSLVGLSRNNGFALPLTLSMLGDALSLSVVQASRIISQLRREGLVHKDRRNLVLLDRERLSRRVHYLAPGPTLRPIPRPLPELGLEEHRFVPALA